MQTADSTHLRFTDHALVRYLERYLDRRAVAHLRERGLRDDAILCRLATQFGSQLDSFRAAVCAHAGRGISSPAVANIPFRLKLGRMRVVIADGRCVTVLPDTRSVS